MVSITAIRKTLKTSAPVTLSKRGGYKCFISKARVQSRRKPFRGLTKCLESKLFSKASMPRAKLHSTIRVRGWKGKMAGRRRGVAVDKQLTSIANGTVKSPGSKTRLHQLTSLALAALEKQGLTLVCAQRGVCSASSSIATAIDLVCIEKGVQALWIVEVKCGYHNIRTTPGKLKGKVAYFRQALSRCTDTAEHRHFAQLASTLHMFLQEERTLRTLQEVHGVSKIKGALLYLSDTQVDFVKMDRWWIDRATSILNAIRK
jgi:hypothetical protein